MTVPNVLAERYASTEMANLFAPEHKIVLERELWVAVLEAQRDLGLDIPADAIEAYRAVIELVDLESIDRREQVTRHDVKARIEEFCALAGHEQVHRGLTSRDLTENVEQLQTRRGLEIVRDRVVSVLIALGDRAGEHRDTAIVGRTHNVPAQVTTVGKRFASIGEEVLLAYRRISDLLVRYPLRGIRGPVGTQQDQLDLLGDAQRVAELDRRVAEHLGFATTLGSVGQVYPRSLDFEVVTALAQAASGPASLATSIRLMAGHDLATEGFVGGQVGSSAMPHKMNTRSCERIGALHVILHGHVAMVGSVAGNQWQEGDVSCSAVRRVALPDAFFAADGALLTVLSVLGGFALFGAVVERELADHLPFLATSRFLTAAVDRGLGREQAHRLIQDHATDAVGDRRMAGAGPTLVERLAADDRFPLARGDLDAMVADPIAFTGTAAEQVDRFVEMVGRVADDHPAAAAYIPEAVL